MPKKTKRRPGPVRYNQPPPRPPVQRSEPSLPGAELSSRAIPTAPFELRDDGSIAAPAAPPAAGDPQPSTLSPQPPSPPRLAYHDEARGLWLYHGNCLEILDAIHRKYGDVGRFNAIFADPPYFLSNGGITCHAGRMVKVDKGDWDKSRGPELNHEFNLEWLRRCQRVLKPNGTLWVTGTHHVIFSVGYALQQLGFKILNDIAWEKPNPPPNLSCRYFTHSTETVIWASKNDKSKHTFNYATMKAVTGKQMKTVWRKEEFPAAREDREAAQGREDLRLPSPPSPPSRDPSSLWTLAAPGRDEKQHGKHPTQKPVALVERCLLASTNQGDLVLDPFLGGGTTAVACVRLRRLFVGIDLDAAYLDMAARRADREVVLIWLREFRIRMTVSVFVQNDLDPPSERINGSGVMNDKPEVQAERIFHECKFVFLSCAQVAHGSVVHTTVDVSLQEAWSRTPQTAKRETTHVVRCETEILRVKP